jgi:DNA-binding NarL/FixJ family response regulator
MSPTGDEQSASLPPPEELERAGLTTEEIELVPLLAENLSFTEIAAALGVERSVVDARALSIYRKLRVTPLSDAIGLLSDPAGSS